MKWTARITWKKVATFMIGRRDFLKQGIVMVTAISLVSSLIALGGYVDVGYMILFLSVMLAITLVIELVIAFVLYRQIMKMTGGVVYYKIEKGAVWDDAGIQKAHTDTAAFTVTKMKNMLVTRRRGAWFRGEGVLYFDSNITRDEAYAVLH